MDGKLHDDPGTPQSLCGDAPSEHPARISTSLQQGFNTIVLGGREEGRQERQVSPKCEMETIFSVEKILNITRKSEPESGREKRADMD